MIQLTLDNCQVSVVNGPQGLKFLKLLDPESKIVVLAPFTQDAARKVGIELSTGLVVASGPLPTANPGENGH